MTGLLERLGIRPRPYRALVWALWTMDLRGQHFAKSTGVQPKMLMSPLFWVVGQCLTMSFIATMVLFARVDLRFFVFANLSLSVMLLATMVLVEFHEVVFDPNDRDTIRHRPIPLRTYAAARFTNLLAYVGLMGFALTVFPAVVGMGQADAGWGYLPAYLAAAFGCSMVAVAAVVWTLSFSGSLGQLKDVLAWSQILGILVLGYGAQFVFRDDSHAFFVWAAFPPAWREQVPTEWLARFVETASTNPGSDTVATGIGLVLLGLLAGAATIVRLRALYADNAPTQLAAVRVLPARHIGRADPGLGPLLSGAAERAGFWMTTRQLNREGTLKVRVLLPLNTPLALLVLGIITDQFEPPALDGASVLPLVAVYGVVVALAPVVYQLRITDSPEASWLFRLAPLPRPAELTLGKAARAIAKAASASATVWVRPSARRSASLSACTPSETRLTPAAAKPWNFPASTELGFASSVISMSLAGVQRAAMRSSTAATVSSRIKEGVPPPKKTDVTTRPSVSSAARSISAR